VRIVEKLAWSPHKCAVIPFLGEASGHRFIDTGIELEGFENRVYVSEPAVKDMGKMLGFPSLEEHEELKSRVEELERELALTRDQLEDADSRLDAIDLLESANFTARKKPGRPRKEAA
jgi:hypothetical protein